MLDCWLCFEIERMARLSCRSIYAATAAGSAFAAATAARAVIMRGNLGSDESGPANPSLVRQLPEAAARSPRYRRLRPSTVRGALARGWRRAGLGVPIILKSICEERKI